MKLADIGLDPTTNTFGAADVALGGKLAKLIELCREQEKKILELEEWKENTISTAQDE